MASASAVTAEKIEITIDGKPVTARRDSYLLEAIRAAGIEVPTLCHHKDLTPNGTCRLCIVEIELRGRPTDKRLDRAVALFCMRCLCGLCCLRGHD